MREDARRCFERHSMSVLGRSVVTGLLVVGIVGIGAESAASGHWRWQGRWSSKSTTTQSITFTSTPPNPAVVGGTYTPTARGGGSGNPVTFSIDPSANGSCSISGATVTFVAVGTCVIDANQAGNASYAAATQVQESFAVVGTQSITFTSTQPNPALIGGTYTVTASGGASGNPVTFSIDPSANGSCSISGATVTFVAVGTCVIDANQAGNASYAAATQVQQSFAVLGTQSIAFTSTPPNPALIGGTYTVTASGGASGNPVTFSIDPSANGSCSISGATVTFVAVGTCVIDANQAGNASYEAATQVQQSFDPDSVAQSIAFTSTPPNPALIGGTYTVTASGGASGNPVTFSIDPSANGSCSISGATVTFVAVGTCVIDANQAGNASYEAATQVQQSFDPGPGTQSIAFTSTPPNPALIGGTYTVTASGGASGNPVTFSIDPSANGSCSISGATVTFVAAGTCVIDANQAGNASYAAATQVQQSFDPDSVAQSIAFTTTPPNPALIGGTYTVTASGGASGNPVTFSIDPSANGSCSISGATVTFVAVGTCVIDANQAGNAGYEAATQVQQSFAVLGTQSIAFTSTPPKPAVVGGTYTVTASGGASGNPVTFSIDPSANGSCSISGATVTFVAVGTCVIDANQAGNASYEAATQVQQSFAVVGTQSITFTSTPPKPAVVGGTYTLTASGGASGNPVTFSIDPSAKGSCGISGATVTFVAVGTCVIDANQAGNASYEPATQVQQSFAVLGTQSITFTSTPPSPAVVGGIYAPTASGGASGNPVTFSIDPSANGSCSISGATVTFVAVGTCVIDANQAGNTSYEAATQVQQSFAAVDSPPEPQWSCNQPANGVCNFPADTTNFVGMNNPNNPPVGLGTQVANNFNSPIAGETQSIGADSASNWEVTNNTPTNPGGGITGYPSNGTWAYTGVLDDYTSLTSTYNLTMPIAGVGGTNANSVAWATSDDWLSAPAEHDGAFTYEVQVHVDTSDSTGGHSCGANVVASNVSIGGSSWLVCSYQHHNSDGTCPGTPASCGEMVFVLGGTYANRVQLTSTSGSVDLKAIFQWLENNNVPSGFSGAGHPYMQVGSALSALSRGWEIVSTGGATQTFTMNGFTVNAAGNAAPPSSKPTGVTFTAGAGHTCVLSWSADPAATKGYDIYWYGPGGSGWYRVPSGTTSTVTGTASGQTFNAEVASSNTGGQGPMAGFYPCTTT